jgi:hypothetical protein
VVLPNPWYVGADGALMPPSASRLLSYGLTTGKQGVLGTTDCAIKELGTPGPYIQAMPGAYNVMAKHLGGSYESYAGSFDEAETVAVSNVGSGGSRRDLVVLVIMDTSVSGSGSWDDPPSAADGPYAAIEVIEGVGTTVWDVSQAGAPYNTWSAITLARIDRPASTGIVDQSHITDLRSLAALGGTRTVIVDAPDPPPIAQEVFAVSTNCNNNHQLLLSNTSYIDWPSQANWQVPVPEWARKVSVMMTGTPASAAHAWGEIRLNFAGTALSPREFDINNAPDGAVNVYRANLHYGGVYTVPEAARGDVVTVKVQAKSNITPGSTRMLIADKVDVDGSAGCYFDLWLLFQRTPDA